jgi:hypothetical protein
MRIPPEIDVARFLMYVNQKMCCAAQMHMAIEDGADDRHVQPIAAPSIRDRAGSDVPYLLISRLPLSISIAGAIALRKVPHAPLPLPDMPNPGVFRKHALHRLRIDDRI